MNRQWKILFACAALSAAVSPGFAAPAKGAAPVPPKAVVSVAEVVTGEDFESRRYTGLVVSKSVVQLVPRVSGELLEVGFKEGGLVKKGQVLYRLDPTQYAAAVKSAEAKITEVKAKLDYAQSNYDRNQTLYEKKAVSRDSFESIKASLNAYKASLMAYEAELITAKDNLKNTTITAPIDGFVGVTNYTAGNYLTPGSGTLATIIQVQPMRVRFAVSIADLLAIFESQRNLKENGVVRLRLANGCDYPEDGVIEMLNNEANRNTDTVQLYALFPNKDYRLFTGGTVNVTLSKRKGRKVPAVEPSAVMHDSRGAYVYVVDSGNIPHKRYIGLGNATGSLQMVKTGLKVGETVVVKGTHKVVEGSAIEPVAGKAK